jgi:hypothetical protein
MAGLSPLGRRRRRRREAARASGNCTFCRKRPANGVSYCGICLARARDYNKRRADRLRRSGLCVGCSRVAEGRYYCRICTASHRRASAARRRFRSRSGLCIWCGQKCDGPQRACAACRSYRREFSLKRRNRIRQKVLARYGNACRCCGISDGRFLTLDHVHDDGHIERKIWTSSMSMYERVLRFKTVNRRYQLLCWNCNEAKRIYGRCPHKAGRRQGA